MRPPPLLMVHVLSSSGVMLGGQHLGRRMGAAWAADTIGAYAVLQLGVALAIALHAALARRWIVSLGALSAAMWGLFCSFMAAMAATGNWL